MVVSVFTDSGCFELENAFSCGFCNHSDYDGRYKRFLFVKWFDDEHNVMLDKFIPMSSVFEFWCQNDI